MVYCTGLENQRLARAREFESHPLRAGVKLIFNKNVTGLRKTRGLRGFVVSDPPACRFYPLRHEIFRN